MRPGLEVADIFRRHGDAYRADQAGNKQQKMRAKFLGYRHAIDSAKSPRCEVGSLRSTTGTLPLCGS
jgi:hypothetical protein